MKLIILLFSVLLFSCNNGLSPIDNDSTEPPIVSVESFYNEYDFDNDYYQQAELENVIIDSIQIKINEITEDTYVDITFINKENINNQKILSFSLNDTLKSYNNKRFLEIPFNTYYLIIGFRDYYTDFPVTGTVNIYGHF